MLPPLRRHTCVRASASAFAVVLAFLLHATAAQALIISEIVFNPVGGFFGNDDGLEWVELFNDGTSTVDLSDYSLGWGGADYTFGTMWLDGAGTLDPGEYIVIGNSLGGNTGPGAAFNFTPNLPDGVFTAGGVGLFAGPTVGAADVPIDSVIYGHIFALNFNGLIDSTGAVGTVDATTGAAAESIQLGAGGTWTASATPTPDTGPLVPIPEPSTALLSGLGLLLLALRRRRA